jgi:hypothetical protein
MGGTRHDTCEFAAQGHDPMLCDEHVYDKKEKENKQPQFQGRVKELKGYVYDCTSGQQSSQYEVTTKKLVEYIQGCFDNLGADAHGSSY